MAKQNPAHDPVSQAMMAIEDALSLNADTDEPHVEEAHASAPAPTLPEPPRRPPS